MALGVVATLVAGAVAWFMFAQLGGPLAHNNDPLRSALPVDGSLTVWRSQGRLAPPGKPKKRTVVREVPDSNTQYALHLPPPDQARDSVFVAELLRRGFEADLADIDEVREYRPTILHGRDAEEREGAILMLSGNEHPEAVSTFIQATNDPSATVRLAALEALDDYAEYLKPTVFAGLLTDRDPAVRYEALDIVGDMHGREATRLVSTALRDPDRQVRDLAAATLSFRGKLNRH